jgi:hypothetical protein
MWARSFWTASFWGGTWGPVANGGTGARTIWARAFWPASFWAWLWGRGPGNSGLPDWAAKAAVFSKATGQTLLAETGGQRGVATGRAVATLIEA